MRKVIKISGTVLSAFVLLLIILPVVLALLLDIPAVQNFVVHKTVALVSERLGTTVRIDRVDIGLFSKLRVEGFYVEDYGRDTLLYASRVEAYVSDLGLFGRGLEFSRGRIVGGKLFLRQMDDGEMNIKQIVGRLSNPDRKRKGDFRLSFRKAEIENMELCLDRREGREREYGIDFTHMHLDSLNARVDDFTIDGQAIYTSIASLSARERSGFRLKQFSGRFYLTQGCLGFEDASILTDRSEIRIPYISLAGSSWADYRDFIGEVRLDAAVRHTTVSTDDIAYFAPRLRDWHLSFSEIDVEAAGVVSDFTTRIRSMRIGDSTTLSATATLRGLPDIRRTHFDLAVPDLCTSAAAVPASPCPGRCAVCWSMPAGWEWTFGSGDCSRRSTCSWAPRPTWATSPAAWGSNPGVRAAAACRERSRRRTCAWATCSGAATCWAMRPSGRVSTGRSVAVLPTHGSRAMSCG